MNEKMKESAIALAGLLFPGGGEGIIDSTVISRILQNLCMARAAFTVRESLFCHAGA